MHCGVHAGFDNRHGLGIGHAHVLAGGTEQAAAGRHQVSGFQEAGQIVQRGIGVAAPQGLHQGGRKVIHGVAALVVAHRAALGNLSGVRTGEIPHAVPQGSRAAKKLHGVHRLAYVAAAGGGDVQREARFPVQGSPGLFDFQRPQDGRLHLLGRHGFELKHRTAGQQRAVHIKIRIFHEFQQALLLLFVEILNLVQIQQNTAGSQKGVHVGNDILDILQRGSGCVQAV